MTRKTDNPKWEKFFWPVVIIFACGVAFAYGLPQYHWWNSDVQRRVAYCDAYVGGMNITNGDSWHDWCYGQGWQYWCKHSYPAYCPGQTDTYAQCLENCQAYGTKDCPCIGKKAKH